MSYKPTIFTNITKPKTHPLEYIDKIHAITIPWQSRFLTLANNTQASENAKKDAAVDYDCMKTLHDKSDTLANLYREKLMTINRSRKL